ncbi:MAG: glycoside hydrolase family 5 protein [Clostridia bacterium]|nr:glycoside hydrolase family 5 protein [Clostridia bacterium]
MQLKFLLLLPCLLLLGITGTGAAEAEIPEFGPFKEFPLPENPGTIFAQKLGAGWDLGNTFDAYDDALKGDPLELESRWVGIKTTREMIQTLRAAGFTSIRIPVSWHNHVDSDFRIDVAWMDRVQTVVDYAIEEGFYVILNTHHDEGEAYFYPDTAHLNSSLAYLTSVWSQMAERFRDYDEHLILESMNEPRLKGTDVEWWYNPGDARCVDSAEIINTLNQRFVDTVRASGGKNSERFLLVPGYDASADGALNAVFRLPTDTLPDHLMVEVHAYTPYEFALNRQGTANFSADNQADRSSVASFMNSLYDTFVAKGIPVVIDEYGALDKDNLQARVDFFAWYVASASARHMPCFVWDNNLFKGNGERFGFLDRKNLTFPHPEIIEAIMTYAIKQ